MEVSEIEKGLRSCEQIIKCMNEIINGDYSCELSAITKAIKAVNKHDNLVQRLEQAEKEVEKLKFHLEKSRPACIDEAFEIGFKNVELQKEVELLKCHLSKIVGFCNRHGKNYNTCRIYGSDDLTDAINEADDVLNYIQKDESEDKP